MLWAALEEVVSTKLDALVDGKARPLDGVLSPGDRHETIRADELIEHARGKAFLEDAGYDSKYIRKAVRAKRMKVVINLSSARKKKPRLDKKLYAKRYMVECFFHDLKRF